jgi:threonyl-tRNA synthetase
MIVIGKREAEEGKISLRSRSNPELDGPHTPSDAISLITEEISSKSLPKSRKSSL